MESNLAIISKATPWKYVKVVLFDVCAIFDWSWNIYVVNLLDIFQKKCWPACNVAKMLKCVNDDSFSFERYPDFLTQMQEYVDDPVTLCDIVGSRFIKVKSTLMR